MTTTTNLLKTPRIGDSVFIGFATNGDGKMVKGGAEIPFDKAAGTTPASQIRVTP